MTVRIYSVVYLASVTPDPDEQMIVDGLQSAGTPALHSFDLPYTVDGVYQEPVPGFISASPETDYKQAWVLYNGSTFSNVVVANIQTPSALPSSPFIQALEPILSPGWLIRPVIEFEF